MNKIMYSLVSFVWIILIIFPYGYYSQYLLYPHISNAFYLVVIFVFALIPVIILLFARLLKKEKMKSLILLLTGLVFLNVISTVVLLSLSPKESIFYPIISKTTAVENYLDIDENIVEEENKKRILYCFPEKIPEFANNTEYYYWADTFSDSVKISVSWDLEENIYNNTKTSSSGSRLVYDDLIVFRHIVSDECCLVSVFDDDKKRVTYLYLQGDLISSEDIEFWQSLYY